MRLNDDAGRGVRGWQCRDGPFSQNNDPNTTPATQAIPAAAGPDRYTIHGDTTPSALAKKVSQAMREGWEPTGGVENSANGGAFYQAMVKHLGQRVTIPATQRQ